MSSPSAGRRMLLLHAHPDDESIMTGGTIARYLDEGVDVRVLTFTLGEEGEVIGNEWAQLVADAADQLGGYRILELSRALSALGSDRFPGPVPRFLGGAGHWRDSGMAGTPSAQNPRALAQADAADVVDTLVAEILAFAPQVIVGYDAAGTYGHPYHITVHDAAAAAVPLAAERLGKPIKHYVSITERSALDSGLAAAVDRVPAGWRMPEPGELPSYPDEQITTEIDVTGVYGRKAAALAAHATQVTVAPSGTEYALSNNIVQPIFGSEHFIRVDPDAPAEASADRETDLFAGVPC